jgi:hypothetical protein
MAEMGTLEVRLRMDVKGGWRLRLVSWLLRGYKVEFGQVEE